MPLTQGDDVPAIKLPEGEPDNLVDFTEFQGEKNLVLLFFPMAFTGVCSEEMCSVSENLDKYNALDAEVFGISVDSPFSQNAWKKDEGIDVDLLSDFNREAVQAFGVMREDLLGLERVANRSAFVVDRDGVIQYSWVSDDPTVLPDFEEIQSVLEDL